MIKPMGNLVIRYSARPTAPFVRCAKQVHIGGSWRPDAVNTRNVRHCQIPSLTLQQTHQPFRASPAITPSKWSTRQSLLTLGPDPRSAGEQGIRWTSGCRTLHLLIPSLQLQWWIHNSSLDNLQVTKSKSLRALGSESDPFCRHGAMYQIRTDTCPLCMLRRLSPT